MPQRCLEQGFARAVICRKATLRFRMLISSLPGANPHFPSTKLGFLCAFASKFFPMVVRRGSMLVVSSRWRPLMMTLAHSPAYRRPGQQYLCLGAPTSSISAKVRRSATKHHREEPAGRDWPKPAQRSRVQEAGLKKVGNKKNRAQRKLCTEESVLETGIEPVRTFLPTGF